MKILLILIAIVSLRVAPLTANAANPNAYLLVKGQKQGQFKGSGVSKSDRIAVLSFDENIQNIGSGKSSSASSLAVEIGSADMPEFTNAATTHENLTSVQLELVKPATTGKITIYCIIKLTNANITSIQVKSNGSTITQEITFSFQKITTTYPNTTQSVDDWKIMPAKG